MSEALFIAGKVSGMNEYVILSVLPGESDLCSRVFMPLYAKHVNGTKYEKLSIFLLNSIIENITNKMAIQVDMNIVDSLKLCLGMMLQLRNMAETIEASKWGSKSTMFEYLAFKIN